MNQAKQLVLREIKYAPDAFKLLDGYFCLYKPKCKGFNRARESVCRRIVSDLNSMDCRPPRERILIEGNLKKELQVNIKTDLSDHVLVSGSRYKEKYIPMWLGNYPGYHASGLIVGIVGPSIIRRKKLFQSYSFPKIYEIKGRFGIASNDFYDTGKIIAKSTYKHLKKDNFEKIICKIEAAQRQQMFKLSGVSLESEDAYRIATSGWAPTAGKKFPIIYAIRTTSFNLPDFCIEIQCSNVTDNYLAEFINEIGLSMKSTAVCTGIRLTKYGPFNVEHSLVENQWDLENLIRNVYLCNEIMKEYRNKQRLEDKSNNNNFKV